MADPEPDLRQLQSPFHTAGKMRPQEAVIPNGFAGFCSVPLDWVFHREDDSHQT